MKARKRAVGCQIQLVDAIRGAFACHTRARFCTAASPSCRRTHAVSSSLCRGFMS